MGVRYWRRGRTRAFFVPTIADIDAPTVTELTAGTELTGDIANIEGFATEQEFIGTPDLASTSTTTVPGEETFAASSLMFYLDSETNPLRTELAKGTVGYVVFIDYKPTGALVADDEVDVYPVQVGAVPKQRDMGSTAAQWTANMAITGVPAEDVVVVAP